jgi:hypothetical protein
MDWDAIDREALDALVAEGLAEAAPEERELFSRAAVTPTKWQLSPWGDTGGGFWVVAVLDDRVLWFNDIEDGFNVSRFVEHGTIPPTEYWCNQDELRWAIRALAGQPAAKFGPPEPLS